MSCTAFLQCFLPPAEHGVADNMALTQAQRARLRNAPGRLQPAVEQTSRKPGREQQSNIDMDWYETVRAQRDYRYRGSLVCDGNRFGITEEDQAGTGRQADLARQHAWRIPAGRRVRRYLVADHRFSVPDLGVYIKIRAPTARPKRSLSRRALLRRAPQGLAHAEEQSRCREP